MFIIIILTIDELLGYGAGDLEIAIKVFDLPRIPTSRTPGVPINSPENSY